MLILTGLYPTSTLVTCTKITMILLIFFFIIIYIAHLRKRLYMVMTSSSDVRALFTREPF